MSNKLLTGVLTLGLMLMGSAMVFADLPSGSKELRPISEMENPNAPYYGQEDAQPRFSERLSREVVSEPFDKTGLDLNIPYVPTFVCGFVDNTDYPSAWGGLSFRNSGALGGDVDAIGNEYDVEPGFLCSLSGVWMFFGAVEGDIDGDIQVWTSFGGLPVVMVAQEIVNSTTLTPGDWNYIDLSAHGLTFTENFVISFGTVIGSAVDAGGPETDRIQSVVDNIDGIAVTPRRGVTHDATVPEWVKNNAFWAQYYNQVAAAATCCEEIPFTDCGVIDEQVDSYSFIFGLPSTVSCRQGFAMRFTSGGYDTLVSADYWFSDYFSGPLAGTGAAMLLEILGDDGAGVPDPTNVLFSTVVGGPGLENDLVPLGSFGYLTVPIGLVLPPGTTYHVACRIDGPQAPGAGTWPGMGADDFTIGEGDPTNLASVFFPGTYGTPDVVTPCDPAPLDGWYNYFATFGINPDFLMFPYVCRDEFISCEFLQNYTSLAFIVPWGEAEGVLGGAGSYPAGGDECRIESYTVGMHAFENIDSVEFVIWGDAGGAPNPADVIYSETVLAVDFPVSPDPDTYCGAGSPSGNTWLWQVFPNGGLGVNVSGAYWIGFEVGFQYGAGDCVSYFWHLIDNGTGVDRSVLLLDDGAGNIAGSVSATVGYGGPYNTITNNYRCCVPFNELACDPGEDWPTYQHDYARTGHSNNPLGEANCNLTTIWSATSDLGANFGGSVIFGDKILIGDDGGFDCRLTLDGSLVWDQTTDGVVAGHFAGATGCRTQATVADVGGTLMAFLGTGLNRDVVAVDANTGAYIWHNTTNAPFPGLHPNASNVKSVVLNDGVDDVLYFAAQTKLYAVYAATGAPYAGWATNPFVMGADNVNAVSTDGTNLFVPTFSGAVPGNLYCIDAATGALVWDLATVLGNPGLYAGVAGVAGYNIPNEGFFSGASYDDDNNAIWANSYFDADFPAEGYCYRLDAATGAAVGAVDPQPSVRSRRATPVIDQNKIYIPSFTKWVSPSYPGFAIFSRSSGFFTGSLDGYNAGDRQYNDGVLSCEQGEDDWFILGTELGQLNFFRMGNNDEYVFTRQTSLTGANGGQWNGGSMAPDLVAFTNLGGITVALAPGADRPRLDIITNPIFELVEFGSPNPISIVFPDAFTNNGCADMTVNEVILDDVAPTAFGDKIELTTVDPALMQKMDEFATFTTNAERFAKVGLMYGEQSGELSPDYRYVKSTGSSLNYRAAAGFPAVVNGAEGANGVYAPLPGTIVAPGEIVDIDIAINGPLVTRGPHPFFAILDTDDPDFFMDDPAQLPAIQLVPVGGCLEDSVRIYFGVGSPNANSTTVYNNANLARFTGNSAHDVEINGFTEGATAFCGGTLTELFGGLRGYSLTPRRIAMTGQSWDGDDYETLLADPNYCTNECAAGYQSGVLLAEYSDDGGASYTQVFGDVAAVSYVDSAQDYSDGGGGWNTTTYPDIFEPDSTIGIYVDETHYGAQEVAALGDFRLIRMDVTNRSQTDSIVELAHWSHHDDDISANNTSNSLQGRPGKGYLYVGSPACEVVHGYVKVPFGCGVDDFSHVINGTSCDQSLSWWSWETANWWDTMYLRSHLLFGNDSIYFQTNMNTFAGEGGASADASADYYFGSFSLAPGETKSLGIAQFAFTDVADGGDDDQFIGFADLINKYAGWGRGDVNNDQTIDLADVLYLAGSVAGGNGPYPFAHLGNVDGLGDPNIADAADVAYMVDYYFNCGPCPVGEWALGLCSAPQ